MSVPLSLRMAVSGEYKMALIEETYRIEMLEVARAMLEDHKRRVWERWHVECDCAQFASEDYLQEIVSSVMEGAAKAKDAEEEK